MERSRIVIMAACSAVLFMLAVGMMSDSHAEGKTGEALFKQHCSLCHPDGGNIVNPQKTLSKKDREKSGIKSKDDIVKAMRKPGPGMTPFDDKTISEKDAKEIAEYVMKKFK
jgi:cytochrome c6